MRCKDKTLPPTKQAGSEEGTADSPTLEEVLSHGSTEKSPPSVTLWSAEGGRWVVSYRAHLREL